MVDQKEVKSVLISVVFLALGLLVVWLTKSWLKIESDPVFIALLLVPILLYVIFSGRLSEIRTPGGLEAKFVDVAEKSVELLAAEPVEPSIGDIQAVEKEGLPELQKSLRNIDESKPITLTISLGKTEHYVRGALLEYVKALSQYRNFKFVIILDKDKRFTAYLPSWMMRQILEMESLGREFVQAINEDRTQTLRRYGVVTNTISSEATNIEALQEMLAQNLEALIALDNERRLQGVVERDQVISRMILALAA